MLESPCAGRAHGGQSGHAGHVRWDPRGGGLRASCRPIGILTEVEDVDVSASTLLQRPFTSFFCVWPRVWPLCLNSCCHSVSSATQSCPTLCCPMNCSTPGLPVHHQLPESAKPMSIKSVMPSNHLILCRPLRLLPSIFPSIRVFSNESALHIRWPKYWSFSFNISPSNEYPGLISFSMDWLDLLAVQRTLKHLLHHRSSKASILRCSAFFIVQLSHPYMTTGKTIALTRWTFVGKVMSQLCNMLSRLVITFLPRSEHLLIPWLQSPSAVILEPQNIKSATVSTVSPSVCHEVMRLDAMILVF